MSNDPNSGEKSVRIRRGKVDSLTLYEITDYELETLAIGSPSSLYLNFALTLLSIAISFLIALLTTTTSSTKTFTIFVVITVLGFIAGIVLLGLWHFSHKSTGSIISRIRERVPADQMVSSSALETGRPANSQESAG